MSYPVGKVAELAGVTVRTLHHYDEIGLLSPSGRSSAGYRRYSDEDIKRLQHVLFYRELGFSLDRIATVMAEHHERCAHLRAQRALLVEQVERLTTMIGAIDTEMEAASMNVNLSPEERLEVFGSWQPAPGYPERAKQLWGETAQWKEAEQRTKSYTKADFQRGKEESDAWVEKLIAAMRSDVEPTSVQAADLAEEHRQLFNRWMFDCTLAVHVKLTEAYRDDSEQLGFLVRPEKQLPGMGAYIATAAATNAARG